MHASNERNGSETHAPVFVADGNGVCGRLNGSVVRECVVSRPLFQHELDGFAIVGIVIVYRSDSKGDIVDIGGKREDVHIVVVVIACNGVVATFVALDRRAARPEENGSFGRESRPDDDFNLGGSRSFLDFSRRILRKANKSVIRRNVDSESRRNPLERVGGAVIRRGIDAAPIFRDVAVLRGRYHYGDGFQHLGQLVSFDEGAQRRR